MNYERLFVKSLLKEEEATVNMSPDRSSEPENMSDEDAWAAANPEISDNEDLSAKFEVDGLDKAEVEKYSEIIVNWGKGIQTAIEQLAQVIKFSAGEKLANAPGSEQFNVLMKQAPKLKSELSAFKSQVEDLEQTVKLAINDAAKERETKIKDLNR